MCRWIMGAQQFQANVATPEGKMRNKIAQSCIQAINHLARTMKSVVYAADSVSDQQGSGMASRSFHSLPSTTTTTTTTTTTSTISNNSSSRNVAYATNTSSSSQQQQQQHHHHKHNNQHHQSHHQRQQDNYYSRDHLLVHQPHTINPGGLQYQSTHQSTKSQHQQQQCLQECCAQGTAPGSAMPPACVSQYFPTRIARPDGEERFHGAGLGRHSKEKMSELKRPYIKAPANKTLFDVQRCKALLSPTSPGDLNQLPCQLHANAHYCSPHLTSPTLPPSLSPTQHTLSRPHKHQSREKDGGRGGGSNMSPQPTRKSKNPLANYMATLTSSPKTRKELNLRKSSQQNSGYSNSSSSSCSSDSSSSSSNANSCCNSTKMIFGMSGGRGRVRGSSTTSGVPSGIPSEGDHLQGYSTLSSSLPSPELPAIEASLRDSFTPSALTEPSTEGLSSSILCPTGPSSVSDVTLLGCHPSSMNVCSHSSCNISHQKNPIQYQQQHYQQPQYLQPQYHHHVHRPNSPQPPQEDSNTSPPYYNKLSYTHHQQQQHNPLTSSISSSPPASLSCPSPPPSTSPEQFEELSSLPSRGVVPTPPDGSPQFIQGGIAVCPTPGSASRDSRSCNRRPSSQTFDERSLQSQQPPSYREVLEHPDRFREPPPSYSTSSLSSSSTNTRNSLSLTSVPCDNDSIEGGRFNSPEGTTREEATSRSRGGAAYGVQDRHSRSHGPDSELSSEGEEGSGQGPNLISERQSSPASSREALYGSCYEKEVI